MENKTQWLEKIENQYFPVFIEDEQLMGFGSLNDGNYIDLLYTHANAQRKGIGSQIYRQLEAEARARQKNQTNCMLYADVSLTALPFFRSMGFDVAHENKVIMKGVELINYRMKKELDKIVCL